MELGYISAQFESKTDPGVISDNPNDPGGKSYGIYQLSKVMLFKYVKQSSFVIKGMISTVAFDAYWKKVANEYPVEFALDQHIFITKELYLPNAIYAKDLGYDTSSRKTQEMVFSIAVQHGGAKSILKMGYVEDALSVEEQVEEVYKARLEYVLKLGLHPQILASLRNRYVVELAAVLAIQETVSEPC